MSLHLTVERIDTDVALTANSDTTVPSQKAIKAYVTGIASGGVPPTTSAADLTAGTLADARLGPNVVLKDATQTITAKAISGATNTITAVPQSAITSLVSDLALKATLDAPTFTGVVILPSTTSVGSVSSVELGYLDGVTSSIQTQIGTKQATLVSGTNIKTINGATVMGTGDLVVNVTSDATPTSASVQPVQSGGVFTALAAKAALASPSLTGTPLAPTAATSTNTTQIATTAFVQAAIPTVNFSLSQYSGAGTSGDPLVISTLSGSVLTSGTVADARLTGNVPLKNGTNVFTGTNTFGNLNIANLTIDGGIISNNDASGYSLYTTGVAKLHNGGPADFGSYVELTAGDAGIFMRSTNGTRYKLTVSNAGALVITAAP